MDVHELDAASNNGVEAMRDLVARAALGTPGRWKVYIIDEVHMLTQGASNALLKTLEEPPAHVVFVLATTDPQKVLPTIRSRTQHFEFRLLGPETLGGLLDTVRAGAGLDLPDEALEVAVRRGKGSARDALSVLDQIAAAGIVEPDSGFIDQLAEAVATRDAQAALVAVAGAVASGRDPLGVAGELADRLRQGFLTVVAPELAAVSGTERSTAEDLAQKMGLAALVRAIEALGTVQVEMRESPDPRLHVEVCLLRLTRPGADDSQAALVERIEGLERALAELSERHSSGGAPPAPAGPVRSQRPESQPTESQPPEPQAAEPAGVSEARRSLGAMRREAAARKGPTAEEPASSEPVRREDRPNDSPSSTAVPESPTPARPDTTSKQARLPTRDEVVQVWGDGLLASLPQKARARFKIGRFIEVEGNEVVFALPNEIHRTYCEEVKKDVEDALSERLGVRIKMRLVTDPEEGADGGRSSDPASSGGRGEPIVVDLSAEEEVEPDLLDPEVLEAETELAGKGLSPTERLKMTFPGAEEV
jgi:DNA polymerase-3 subunit gamma/tau